MNYRKLFRQTRDFEQAACDQLFQAVQDAQGQHRQVEERGGAAGGEPTSRGEEEAPSPTEEGEAGAGAEVGAGAGGGGGGGGGVGAAARYVAPRRRGGGRSSRRRSATCATACSATRRATRWPWSGLSRRMTPHGGCKAVVYSRRHLPRHKCRGWF